MRQSHPQTGLEALCRLFGHSRQAYYSIQHTRKRDHLQEMFVLNLVEETRKEMTCKLGVRKLKVLLDQKLQAHGIQMGRDQLFNLLRLYGLLLRKRRRKPKTTDSYHWLHKYPNLIKDLEVTQAHRLWVSDITYIRLRSGFSYLSLITDAYSRKIVGHCLHPTLHAEGCEQALIVALAQWTNLGEWTLIHHSDKGTQYCSKKYVDMLMKRKIRISMGTGPAENAIAERINGTIKEEFRPGKVYDNYLDAKMDIDQIVRIYNEQRPHSSIDYLTPDSAHNREGILPKRWKTYPPKWRDRPIQ
jgi:transposase InsO family protein